MHLPRLDVREWRRTIEFRTALIHKRTRCKNQLRSLLRTYAIASPPRTAEAVVAYVDDLHRARLDVVPFLRVAMPNKGG